jgi:hypothetical protein
LTTSPGAARAGRGAASRYGELAAELVRLRADVLVTDGCATTRAATSTIPVVFLVGDPVAQGFVASLSRPGGNLTEVAIITGGLNPKRIQLLKEAVPSLTRLAVLEDGSVPSGAPETWPAIESASRQQGLQLMPPLEVPSRNAVGAFHLKPRGDPRSNVVRIDLLRDHQNRESARTSYVPRLPNQRPIARTVTSASAGTARTSPSD